MVWTRTGEENVRGRLRGGLCRCLWRVRVEDVEEEVAVFDADHVGIVVYVMCMVGVISGM